MATDPAVTPLCSTAAIADYMTFDCSVNSWSCPMDSVNPTIAHVAPLWDTIDERVDSESGATVMKGNGDTQPASPATTPKPLRRTQARLKPVSPKQQLQSELWAARLGFCGEWQLDVIPGCATGLPNQFDYHPFRFIDHKERARIRRQAAGRTAERLDEIGARFYMDFGFFRASNSDFSRPTAAKDRVVQSHDGYNAYLAIVDEKS